MILAIAFFQLALSANALDVPEAKGPYDHRHVQFERDLDRVFKKAKSEHKLVFFKPVYGGVDAEGAKDYHEGCW